MEINDIITPSTTIFWFRRDLRLSDNAGLFHALKENDLVLPIFIFDTEILSNLEDKADRRVEFIHESLQQLKKELEDLGSSLLIFHGNPVDILKKIHPKALYTNHDYDPYARKRDENVTSLMKAKGIKFKSFKDQVIFEKDEVVKDDGKPYTVFTPYSKKWKAKLKAPDIKSYSTEKHFASLLKIKPLEFPSLSEIGFKSTNTTFPERLIKKSILVKYDQLRNFPFVEGTTRLSVHLRFGTISIRKLVALAKETNEIWLNELIWREFYQMILWHFPNIENSFKPAYDYINWINNEEDFQRWCNGTTGYPIIDAGMRELNSTGFMHNRVRMITASFLTKHLLIDWRWGEAYFAKKLLDFDLAANNGGWQWASGSGCDAAPYFRVFNPYLQQEKFDPDKVYIKKWVPEIETNQYPTPMIDHNFASKRAIKVYKEALSTTIK